MNAFSNFFQHSFRIFTTVYYTHSFNKRIFSPLSLLLVFIVQLFNKLLVNLSIDVLPSWYSKKPISEATLSRIVSIMCRERGEHERGAKLPQTRNKDGNKTVDNLKTGDDADMMNQNQRKRSSLMMLSGKRRPSNFSTVPEGPNCGAFGNFGEDTLDGIVLNSGSNSVIRRTSLP